MELVKVLQELVSTTCVSATGGGGGGGGGGGAAGGGGGGGGHGSLFRCSSGIDINDSFSLALI